MNDINRCRPLPCSHSPQGYRLALRVNEACTALGISRSSLYDLMATGKIRTSVVAGRRLIPIKELERLVDAGMKGAD